MFDLDRDSDDASSRIMNDMFMIMLLLFMILLAHSVPKQEQVPEQKTVEVVDPPQASEQPPQRVEVFWNGEQQFRIDQTAYPTLSVALDSQHLTSETQVTVHVPGELSLETAAPLAQVAQQMPLITVFQFSLMPGGQP